ncbi:hypothetical protein AVEN_42880-1 [Araneus ventricosus]|uniref:Uncharacterized protein n=1 Tax=Araneus ventricosus TaxID=182803 RepID=A0A4Y2AGI7_ARAVE|nr:hypothetical protein AVEN_42880-1 [Araneus ventricosus]
MIIFADLYNISQLIAAEYKSTEEYVDGVIRAGLKPIGPIAPNRDPASESTLRSFQWGNDADRIQAMSTITRGCKIKLKNLKELFLKIFSYTKNTKRKHFNRQKIGSRDFDESPHFIAPRVRKKTFLTDEISYVTTSPKLHSFC